MNDKENTTHQNLRGPANAVLRGKFIAVNTYSKRGEGLQINNITFYIKEPEKRRAN